MRNDKDERELMQLAQTIVNWDKVDANQIINELNRFFYLVQKHNYEPGNFGITPQSVPTAYVPKLLKDSELVLATDKNKQCIFGSSPPFSVKSIDKIKKSLKLVRKLS